MTKHPRYQDYVIKDGKFIGEFEQMYQDFDDPWEQKSKENFASEKAVAINWCQKLSSEQQRPLKVIELGCGFGIFTNNLKKAGCNVLGMDISNTAVEKAKLTYPDCHFLTGDILDFQIYEKFKPDVFILAELTWYVLKQLPEFLNYIKDNHKNAYLIHLLTVYPEGTQKYGKEYFTDLPGILNYWNLNFIESGETTHWNSGGCKRTFFLARI